ncbi:MULTISPECIES: threonine dehydratase [Pseudomonas]|uniref:L-threonine dehydratase biosynthetic IlvA n=1 Tax=Pseudomonas putida TaxID=303 RepID=A0A1B2F9L8_PSEPU|nr:MULTISPECIES: threonine dehydratase [Pseudomonas]ANY88816.1 L-threonine dehydratase biosynthetic IlvA [Pseudomonas putida]MCL8305936.1 threonine dehydratase [Pseudomonas putida]
MFDLPALREAADFVRQHVPATAQHAWPLLAERLGCKVWVKHENHAPTGAFKVRGGLVYVRSLLATGKPVRGLVTATRGNHGQSMALAARQAGVPLVIVVPEGNSREKNAAMRALGAELVEHGVDFDVAREEAARLAESLGYTMVPSFHPELVRGVATYALELFDAVADLDCVYVPIGMGSGICGLIQARNLLGLKTQIVGVVSSAADAYAQSFEQGRIVTTETADTFADGMACRVPHPDALTLIREHAARIVRVTDDEVAHAMRLYHEATHNTAEGAGAAALAALMQERALQPGKRVAVVLSGANIDRERYARVLLGA